MIYWYQFLDLEHFDCVVVSTVFETECCDVERTGRRLIAENFIKISSSNPEILKAELDRNLEKEDVDFCKGWLGPCHYKKLPFQAIRALEVTTKEWET